jgi:hypothetical protein
MGLILSQQPSDGKTAAGIGSLEFMDLEGDRRSSILGQNGGRSYLFLLLSYLMTSLSPLH